MTIAKTRINVPVFGFDLTLGPARLQQPLGWKRLHMIFFNSMSDLFQKAFHKHR